MLIDFLLFRLAFAEIYTSFFAQLSDAELLEIAKEHAALIPDYDPRSPERNLLTADYFHPDPAVAYRKATDFRLLYRIYRKAARRRRELIALQNGQVGKSSTGAKYKYASETALLTHRLQKKKTAEFIENAYIHDSSTATSVPLKDVYVTPEALAAKRLSFLKAIERLASEAGLRWAMMTITLPAEYHPNPSNGNKSFNNKGFDEQQKLLAKAFNKVAAMTRKFGVRLSGVRVHEPHADGTPHWHVLFFYKTEEQLIRIARCFFYHFPERLRVRRVLTDADGFVQTDKAGRLKFDVKVFDTIKDFDANREYRTAGRDAFDPNKAAAQCQLDIGASKLAVLETDSDEVVKQKEAHNLKVSSMSSYVMKYVNKTTLNTSQKLPVSQSLPLELIEANRSIWGIRSVQFFGIPAIAQKYDMLRSIDLKNENLDALVREYATLAQQDKGSGVYELMKRAGGLAVAPTRAEVKLSSIAIDAQTRYGAAARKVTGISIETEDASSIADNLKSTTKSIVLQRAAKGLEDAAEYAHNERETLVSGEFARQLVYLCITPTFSTGELPNPFVISTAEHATRAQVSAATADKDSSHALIAAAGAGKSHTLVERVKYLRAQGIKREDILVFSYTKQSARDLTARLAQNVGYGVKCTTMHSFARSLIKDRPDFVNHGQADADEYLRDFLRFDLQNYFHKYYVLVDEAQDLNELNYQFLRYLAKTLYAVGDFRQAIYQFRGARPDLFHEFKDRLTAQLGVTRDMFKETKLVHAILTTFRNSIAVNALANAIAYQLDSSAPFTAALDSAAKGAVHAHYCVKESEEDEAIFDYLQHASKSETRRNAVLCRTRAQVQHIKSQLVTRGITDVEVDTIHAAKGLEYYNVVIALGLRSDREETDDFPNLLYVAVTRAENEILITSRGALPVAMANALEHCKVHQI